MTIRKTKLKRGIEATQRAMEMDKALYPNDYDRGTFHLLVLASEVLRPQQMRIFFQHNILGVPFDEINKKLKVPRSDRSYRKAVKNLIEAMKAYTTVKKEYNKTNKEYNKEENQ